MWTNPLVAHMQQNHAYESIRNIGGGNHCAASSSEWPSTPSPELLKYTIAYYLSVAGRFLNTIAHQLLDTVNIATVNHEEIL